MGTGYSMLHLRKGTGTYYFRRVVPQPLRSILGREIVVSLKTKDKEEAKRKVKAEGIKADQRFADAWEKHRRLVGNPEALAEEWKQALLRDDAEARSLFQPKTKEELDTELEDLEGLLSESKNVLALGYLRPDIAEAIRSILKKHGLRLSADSPEFRRMAHAFIRATADAVRIIRKRAEGDWQEDVVSERVSVPLLAEVDPEENPSLSLLLDKWIAERKPPSKTRHEWEAHLRRFREVVGGDLPVKGITKAHVRRFKDDLMQLPPRVPKKLQGKTVPEILEAVGPDPSTPRLTAAAVRKSLAAIQSVLGWAVRQGYIESNPASGLMPREGKALREEGRVPYDADDLKRIFMSPVFTGCKSLARRTEPGPDVIRDASYWLPLLGLFTGARLEELGQLLVSDVREEDGISYLDIRAGDGKSLKTKSSMRKVPLHPELIRLGFLEYAKGQQGPRVFPELKPDTHGKLTSHWSKWYGRYARAIGLTDPRKTFHSFRHTFKDACRRAEISEEHHDALTGHSNGSVGRGYGVGVPLKVLAGAVEKISYPGVELCLAGWPQTAGGNA